MENGYDGRAIANYVLDFCEKRGRGVTNLALQKIVYFCHVWTLLDRQQPLIKHEFEAWKHGPVIQYLYHDFKEFDNAPITKRALSLDPFTGERTKAFCVLDDATEKLLARIIDFYSQLSASHLVDLSHVEDGPWHTVWYHGGNVNPGMRIKNEQIVRFYSRTMPRFRVQ